MPTHDVQNTGGVLAGGGGSVQPTAPAAAVPAAAVPAAAVPGAAMPGAAASPMSSEVSPELQESYDNVVMAAMTVLFDNKKSREGIVKRLKADTDNPAKALGETAAMVMIQLDKQSGEKIPEEVILPAAIEILEQLTELASSMDVFPIDDAVINLAGQLMVKILGEAYGTTQEDIEQMMGSMSQQEIQAIEEEQGNYARKQPPPQEQI